MSCPNLRRPLHHIRPIHPTCGWLRLWWRRRRRRRWWWRGATCAEHGMTASHQIRWRVVPAGTGHIPPACHRCRLWRWTIFADDAVHQQRHTAACDGPPDSSAGGAKHNRSSALIQHICCSGRIAAAAPPQPPVPLAAALLGGVLAVADWPPPSERSWRLGFAQHSRRHLGCV